MYKLMPQNPRVQTIGVIRLSDNTCIPPNPDNADYQAYLKWVSEGGVPLPADE